MRVLALVVTAILLAGCSPDPSPSTAPERSVAISQPSIDAPSAGPSASTAVPASPKPAVTPSPTTLPTTKPSAPSRLAWTKWGGRLSTGAGGSVAGVRKVGDGYVAWGTYGKANDDDPLFATWYSADGRAWDRTVHARTIVPCPNWAERTTFDAVSEPVSDGHTIVFAVGELKHDENACLSVQLISLASADGHTWLRSAPYGPPNVLGFGISATSAGWETTADAVDDVVETVWRSTDLVTWSQVASRPAPADEGPSFQVLATSSDGIHLGVLQTPSDVGPSRSTLKASENGSDWHPVRTLPPDAYVVGVAPPTAPGRPWLVAIEREDPEEARILASRDLVSWTRVTFDKPGIRGLTATKDGWVAVGFYPSRDTGCYESCRPERPSLYTSHDGKTWVKRPSSTPPAHTDILGSAGDGRVLAAGWPTKDGVTLWRLDIEG